MRVRAAGPRGRGRRTTIRSARVHKVRNRRNVPGGAARDSARDAFAGHAGRLRPARRANRQLLLDPRQSLQLSQSIFRV